MTDEELPEDEGWVSWIEMEEIHDAVDPWAVLAFGWCLVLAMLGIAFLIRMSR